MCLSKAGQSDYKPVARYKLARLFTIGSQHVRYKQPQKPTFHPVTALGGACLGLPQLFLHVLEWHGTIFPLPGVSNKML